MAKCTQCGYQASSAFCPSCGQPMSLACPQCGAETAPGTRFCGACGAQLEAVTRPAEVGSGHRVQFGDIGMVQGGIDASSHTTTNIGSQTTFSGPIGSVNLFSPAPEPTAADLVRRGCDALQARQYSSAASLFEKAQNTGQGGADVGYYLALATLGGKRPKLLAMGTIRKVEEMLQSATLLDPHCDHARLLWALVKQDYYVMNGMFDRPPTVAQLLSQCGRVTAQHAGELRAHLSAPGNPVWESLR